MKKRFLWMICAVVVTLCVSAIWFYTPISLENKSNKYLVDFSVDHPSKLLEEAIIRLPLSGLWYSLDFMSIEYETANNGYTVKNVKFGFSHYLGFDFYGASCISYNGSSVKSEYMLEEAKTIYDDLYEGIAFIRCGTGELRRYLESAELSFTSIIDNVISVEAQNLNFGITAKIDDKNGIITFFEE